MNKWIASTDIIQNIRNNLLQPKQYYYSEEVIKYKIINFPYLKIKHLSIRNNYKEMLFGMLIKNRNKKNKFCIVFMHGLESNVLQGSILIDHLGLDVDLFCFDFSGSGKSQGKYNTYGYKQHQDLQNVIKILDKQQYQKYILWGRSMGAVACLLHSIKTKHQEKILVQILDSPFNNFQSICTHNASNYMKIPQIFIPTAINILKECFSTHPFDPFNINISAEIHKCSIPSLFFFNQNDQVIPPCKNSEEIIRNLHGQCYYQKFVIGESHNQTRTAATLNLIFQKIYKFMALQGRQWNNKVQNKKAISVYSRFKKQINDECLENRTSDSHNKKQERSVKNIAPRLSLCKKITIRSQDNQKLKKQNLQQKQQECIKYKNKH